MLEVAVEAGLESALGVVFGRLCTSTDLDTLDTSLFFGPRSAIHVYSALCLLFCGSDDRTMHSSARNTESGNLKTPPRPLFTSKCFQPLPTLAEPISMHCIVVSHFVCASMHITDDMGLHFKVRRPWTKVLTRYPTQPVHLACSCSSQGLLVHQTRL